MYPEQPDPISLASVHLQIDFTTYRELNVSMEYMLTGKGVPANWTLAEEAHSGAEARRFTTELLTVAKKLDHGLKK